jgi:hypothetical protein
MVDSGIAGLSSAQQWLQSESCNCTVANRYAPNHLGVPDRLGSMPYLRRFFCLLALVASATPAFAQPFEAVGSRALGMGGAFVAVADDASGGYWNPAGLASGQPAGGILEWNRFQNGDRDAAPTKGAWERSTRFTSLGTWPMGLNYTRVDEVSLADTNRIERFTTQQYGLSVLQTITEGVVIGSTLKYVRGNVGASVMDLTSVGEAMEIGRDLDGKSSGAFDLDLSAMYDARAFRIGATVKNLRAPKFEGRDGLVRELERRSRVGLAVFPAAGLTLAIDLDLDTVTLPTGPQRVVAAGGEHQFSPRVVLRAGARRNLEGTRATVGTAGASVAIRPGTWLDAHATLGRSSGERGFGIGLRAGW